VTEKPFCPTATDALCQAMERAMDTMGDPGVLTAVSFGRFSEPGAGWYWTLDITRRIASEHGHLKQRPDHRDVRIRMVFEQWQHDTARYGELDRADASARDDSDMKFGEER
jgi:hypothetical protein